jgi:hypothetical protein
MAMSLIEGAPTMKGEDQLANSINLIQDGVDYVISMHVEPNGFFGNWKCERCGEESTKPVSMPTVDGVVTITKLLLREHHLLKHK